MQTPLHGGILIGGRATRMGTPKQLLRFGGETFLERVAAALRPHVAEVVLLGAGEVPSNCAAWPRLPDAPDAAGPLAGMLAALRRPPAAAWIFVACDMPFVTPQAVAWLIAQRGPDRWAVLPQVVTAENNAGQAEPLLALYEPEVRSYLEEFARRGWHGPHRVARCANVATPAVPPHLAAAWRNFNTPADLEALEE